MRAPMAAPKITGHAVNKSPTARLAALDADENVQLPEILRVVKILKCIQR